MSTVDAILRGDGRFAPGMTDSGTRSWLGWAALGGSAYGACMGLHVGDPEQALYSAIKVPLLFLVSGLVVAPSFWILLRVLGLAEDQAAVLRGVLAAQAVFALVLASLGPITLFVYLNRPSYPLATTTSGVAFLIALAMGARRLARHQRPLVARDARHRTFVRLWPILHAFVTIQAAWVLRPFVGWPDREATFLRDQAWDNAYVIVFDIIGRVLRGAG